MASMRTKIASSSSSSTPRLTYDVFLSFRGKDTRNGFTDHLYAALKQKNILTFRDDGKLEKGKSISPELLKAIKESKLAIVIFSKNYASSTWCLDELTKVIGSMEETGMTILPIFYHVDPSDVRKQIRTFAKAFVEHEKENTEKVQTWRAALKKVAEISGWHLHKGSEAKFIQDIVEVAFDKLNHKFSIDTKGLVGMNPRVEQLKSHLAIGSEDVRIIGIWGIGGMGKTTLARVVYDMVFDQFEACSFIANVGENSKKITWLQKNLLKELLKCKDVEVEDVNNRVLMLKNRLRRKKVLLVLDDVNQSEQLDKLVGGHDSFGPGSRVMITTRDKHLLVKHRANEIYEVEPLNNAEALQLFSLKAFEKDHPDIDYVELSQAFVCYSRGLPLALEVLGSFLINRSIHEWKSDLDRLKKFPKRKILDVLQISFDGLEEMEKEIFLNIACFFNHENQETIKEILDILGFSTEIGLSVLREKSLIKLSGNHVWMHDLLQEMGQDIVRCECNDLGERSRLWLYGDIDNVLTKNMGTKKIKGIVLELNEREKVDWDPQAFSKMQNLQLLIIKNVHLMHGPKNLPKDLRFLDWSQYPLKSLPSSFQSNELVKLCLNCSYIERLWEGAKSFRSLKFIQSNKSLKLIETPDFTKVPHLEILILEDCINLWKIHPSIRFLKKLTHLNLKGCKNLRNLPTFLAMESLNILNFSGCSKVKRIPEFGENMKRLSKLFLDGIAITKLPTSIGNLTNLASFSGKDCKNLVSLPSTFSNMKSLKHADFSGCSKLLGNLRTIESVGKPDVSGTSIQPMPSSYSLCQALKKLISIGFKPLPFYSMSSSPDPLGLLSPSLKTLNLSDCNLTVISNDIGRLFSLDELKLSGNSFDCLPKSIAQLPFLKSLWLDNCTSLRSLPKLPVKIDYIRACGCTSLEMVPDLLKPNSSCEPRVYLIDCSKLANNQACIDVFIARIKKHHQVLSQEERYDTLDFEQRYDIIIPGSEIPKWFTHQGIGAKVIIKEPSHLCKENEWIGIAVCALFCPNPRFRIQDGSFIHCCLIVNGKIMFLIPNSSNFVILSDHIWLLYLVPEFYGEDIKNSLKECDADGFNHIEIRFISQYSVLEVNESKVNICMAFKVKKCGLRMVYKKDIEDLNRTMAQDSNDNIKGMDVPLHSADNSESNKLKQRRDDYNGAGPSGEGSSRVTEKLSDLEESREYLENLLFFLPHL